MVKMVLEEFDSILGLKANAQFSKVYRWNKGMPKYTVGHLDRIALLDRMLTIHPGYISSAARIKGSESATACMKRKLRRRKY